MHESENLWIPLNWLLILIGIAVSLIALLGLYQLHPQTRAERILRLLLVGVLILGGMTVVLGMLT